MTQEPLEFEVLEPAITVPVRNGDGTSTDMPLNKYLTGVLLAEMPASFHIEALKAQSVAARTYTWKAFTNGGKHGDSSVCKDSACCQGFLSEEDYLFCGGTREDLLKVCRAVDATSTMVLSFEGNLIEATYFSSSGGTTEAAVAVWGAEYPYLQSVSSPEDHVVPVTCDFSADEFQRLLGKSLSGEPAQWFDAVTYTDGGGVAAIEICGENYTGTRIREILGLRSTAFQIMTNGQNISITTHGYGHRVGMSQHGANTMAENGKTWQQILQHYYPGTQLHPIADFADAPSQPPDL
jgi:stage II sporulation protein D